MSIKVAVIGGGTGLSTMLRGLKEYTSQITAIVTVSDNGGGSGVIRKEMNMLPPGDIRNCIMALSNTEPMLEKLFNYRFSNESYEGQSFGNLYLAAMTDILGNFEEAVRHTGEVLNITGKVLPVTAENVQLCAKFDNGTVIKGETEIVYHCKNNQLKIEHIYLEPSMPEPLTEAIKAITEADLVILGPGSLYTSIIPNLLVNQIVDAIVKSTGTKIYIANVMTQTGETEGYDLKDHVLAIEKYLGIDIIEYIIVNSQPIPQVYLDFYKEEHATPVDFSRELIDRRAKVVAEDILKLYNNPMYVRHDSKKLADIIFRIYDNV